MRWSTTLSIAACAAMVSAASVARGALDVLQPWQLTAMRTGSPPYRPNSTIPAGLGFTIADPNQLNAGPGHRGTVVFPPSTANCTAQWLEGESPYGRARNCTEVLYGHWAFEVVETSTKYGTWPLQNFDILITRVYNVTALGNLYTKVYEGRAHFEVGATLGGLCGASGICSFQLKNETSPVLIRQSRTACLGDCP